MAFRPFRPLLATRWGSLAPKNFLISLDHCPSRLGGAMSTALRPLRPPTSPVCNIEYRVASDVSVLPRPI
eukprot:scaffold13625_cov112-Isochrysis_galbana.AAC.4